MTECHLSGTDCEPRWPSRWPAVTAGDPLPGETPEESAPSSPRTQAGAKPAVTHAEAEEALRAFVAKYDTNRARDLLRSYGVSYLKALSAGTLGLFVDELRRS